MHQITKKLRLEFADKFMTIAEGLREEGQTDYEISKIFMDFVKSETARFYRKKSNPIGLGEIIGGLNLRKAYKAADSKIETVYCEIFDQENIPFHFQYPIGPFIADFLISKKIVFEIDGPMHDKEKDEKRDQYIKNLGYTVFRVPDWLAAVSSDSVVSEIKGFF